MPLGSFLRFDPWTDQVIQLHTAFEPILNARDKMPFEVTPVYLKLTYYNPNAQQQQAPAAGGTSGAGNGAAAQGQAAPAATDNAVAAPGAPAAAAPAAGNGAVAVPPQ